MTGYRSPLRVHVSHRDSRLQAYAWDALPRAELVAPEASTSYDDVLTPPERAWFSSFAGPRPGWAMVQAHPWVKDQGLLGLPHPGLSPRLHGMGGRLVAQYVCTTSTRRPRARLHRSYIERRETPPARRLRARRRATIRVRRCV